MGITCGQRSSAILSDPMIKKAQSLFALNVREGSICICNCHLPQMFVTQPSESPNDSKDPELAALCLTGAYVHVCEDSCAEKDECKERKVDLS